MIDLKSTFGEWVRVTTVQGNVCTGLVGDYLDPYDTEEEYEGIVLDHCVRVRDGYAYPNPIEFDAPNIKDVEVIEKP